MSKLRRRISWWPALVVAVLLICAIAAVKGTQQLIQVQQELELIKQTNLELDKRNRALYQKVLRLRGDDQALERAARQEMGLVRPDEFVYQDSMANPAPRPKE
ncbi:MAG: septum formation initiator family protein [Desulfarculaceae bacterium]